MGLELLSQKGFSLVETLVAFVVVGLVSVGALSAIRSSVIAADEAEKRYLALQQAQSLITEAQSGDPLLYEGQGAYGEDGGTWVRQVTALALVEDVYRVEVRVSWRNGAADKTLNLVSYRYGYELEDG